MDESNNPGNRRSRRSNVLLAATLELGATTFSVKLRNLSEHGALIEGPNLPIEGSEILFKRNDLNVPGRIAWVNGTHAGIAFSVTLSTQDVLQNIPQPTPRVQSEYKRPGFGPRVLSPQEQAAMEHWMALMAMKRF